MTTEKNELRDAQEVIREMGVPEPTIGSSLRTARLCEEATLSDFAERLGITKQELSNIEKGRSAVSLKRALLFATKLGYSLELYAKFALEDEARRHGLLIEILIKEPMSKTAARVARKAKAAERAALKREEKKVVKVRRPTRLPFSAAKKGPSPAAKGA